MVSDFTQIDIHDLAMFQANGLTLRYPQNGFRQWREPSQSLPAAILSTVTDDDAMTSWFSHVNLIEKTVPALGCYEIADISIRGHGLLFSDGRHVREVSHIAEVASSDAQSIASDIPLIIKNCATPGLSIIGPGYRVYGHWLIDFLPRVKIAQAIYGHDLGGALIPLPLDTPSWALNLLFVVTGISTENIVYYDIATEKVNFDRLIVPTYAHASYHFHATMSEFYPSPKFQTPSRKICITRQNYEVKTDGVLKKLVGRELFEQHALSHGYELVAPEQTSIREQISIFREANKIIGEYGSALHNTVFSNFGVAVGMIRCPNDVQLRISALRQQPVVLMLPDKEWIAESGAQTYTLSEGIMERFFEEMERVGVSC